MPDLGRLPPLLVRCIRVVDLGQEWRRLGLRKYRSSAMQDMQKPASQGIAFFIESTKDLGLFHHCFSSPLRSIHIGKHDMLVSPSFPKTGSTPRV